ncbi:MAG: phosphate acyltransferase PlsX [Candidatus Omnitrophota bacterium]
MKIVVDAMGGDHAPRVVVEGVVAAVREFGVEVILCGDEAKITPLLKKIKYSGNNIEVLHAPEVIDMCEPAANSVRRKRKSSIVLGLNLIKTGVAGAFFSAGNTGAVVCAATLELRMLPGVERPGIGIVTPALKGVSFIIDVGANIDAKPKHLLQYGIMADAYCRNILNKDNPTVGLLNIGEEEAKGTDFMRHTHELLSKSRLNFIGNIEGKSLFSGKSDIIITDGFVGNVALKVSESAAEAMQTFLKRHLLSNLMGKIGLFFLLPSLKRFKKDIDYAEYGGAPLLGVNGVVIIGHGRSNARAIKNAVRVANEQIKRKVNDKILEAIKYN